MIAIQEFPDGITVQELKAILSKWPEKNADGVDCEVWITTRNGLSSPVCHVVPLNLRFDDDVESADVLLESSNG